MSEIATVDLDPVDDQVDDRQQAPTPADHGQRQADAPPAFTMHDCRPTITDRVSSIELTLSAAGAGFVAGAYRHLRAEVDRRRAEHYRQARADAEAKSVHLARVLKLRERLEAATATHRDLKERFDAAGRELSRLLLEGGDTTAAQGERDRLGDELLAAKRRLDETGPASEEAERRAASELRAAIRTAHLALRHEGVVESQRLQAGLAAVVLPRLAALAVAGALSGESVHQALAEHGQLPPAPPNPDEVTTRGKGIEVSPFATGVVGISPIFPDRAVG